MSQQNSDFTAGEFGDPDFATTSEEMQDQPVIPAAPQYRKIGFSIYTVMLICSFVFLMTAMILMFMEAGSPDYK